MNRVSEPHDSLSLGVTKFQFLQCDLCVLLVSVKHKYQMCGTKITKIYGPLSLNLGPYQGQIQRTRSHIFPMVYQQMPYSSSHSHPYSPVYLHMFLVVLGIAKASFLSKITNSEFRVAFSGEDIEVWDQSPQERGWKIRLFRGDIFILITLPCYIRNKMLEFVVCVMCCCTRGHTK